MVMPRSRSAELAILIVAVLLVAVLALLRSSQSAAMPSEPSTFDTGANGYAALYSLLQQERVPAERYEFPAAQIDGRGTLVIAGDGALAAAASSPEVPGALDRWTRNGSMLVILDGSVSRASRSAFGLLPLSRARSSATARTGCAFAASQRGLTIAGTFGGAGTAACDSRRAAVFANGADAYAIAYRRGRGTIVFVDTPSVFDNLHLSQRSNARAAYAVLAGHGPVLFDERVHGYAAGRSFWEVLPVAMRVAILLAIAAAVLAIVGANLPFAPPYRVPSQEERDSAAYIASVARMLERGGAANEAVARIAARCERVLAPRAGGDERARMLLRELRTLESTPRPGTNDVLHAGRIFARVRKDYGC